MIAYPQAMEVLRELAQTRMLPSERVMVQHAVGMVLAERVLSRENLPGFDNSAMDGFAVVAAQTEGATPLNAVMLKVQASLAAGDAFSDSIVARADAACEIMTGAPVPAGYNAIVRVEDTERSGNHVKIFKAIKAGENLRRAGTDFTKGQTVLEKGVLLWPEHLLALTSLGVRELDVQRRPRVAILSTGKELVPCDTEQLRPGEIRNSTGPFLYHALLAAGVDTRSYGIIRDDPSEYLEKLELALLEGADVVLSTGAVSMGKFDFVRGALESRGAKVYFHKCAMRPGKPILVAEAGGESGAIVFGMPGNPISTAVALRFFVMPYLRAIQGLPPEQVVRGRLSSSVAKPPGLRCFFKARASSKDGAIEVTALHGQASYLVGPMLFANAWAVFPETADAQAKSGDLVEIYPLHDSMDGGLFG